ncbi:tRNA-Phe hydroxylase [Aureococcus anophagefferens]|nr:tRNA-Phe hydroxylase [Aureococcus anophagefferens]
MQLATGKSKRYRFWQTPEFKAAVCFGLALASLCYLGYQLYDPRYAGLRDDDVAKPYVAVHASTVGAPHEARPDPGATRRSSGGRRRRSKKELPLVVRHIGEVDAVVKEWSTPGVLERRLGTKYYRCERSDDNHFMYHGGHGGLRGWSSPTENVQMRYADWLAYARNAYNTTVLEDHYYFRVSPPDMTPKDVPIFSRDDPLFMPKFKESKGVHCRFGYAGIIAEAHFDGSRNMVCNSRSGHSTAWQADVGKCGF